MTKQRKMGGLRVRPLCRFNRTIRSAARAKGADSKSTLLGLVLIFLLSSPLLAHEIGKTQVNATFLRDGRYVIDIRVDPQSVVQRLEFAAGRELSSDTTAPQLERRLIELKGDFLQKTAIEFDGKRVQPSMSYKFTPTPPTRRGLEGIVTLSGEVPKGAKSFRWSYAMLYSSYALVVKKEGSAKEETFWLEGDAMSPPISIENIYEPSRLEIAKQYLLLGFTHIVPKGLDHILFVLGVFLLSLRWRWILAQVTAFTIAHSITLGLTIYGVVSLPSRVVEPMIALSIVYVAIENIATKKLHVWRVVIVFCFGLLHGMGFAGVLSELGLPRSRFLTALVTFNVGVELGQLTVITGAFLLLASWSRKYDWYRQRIVIPASLLIAATGLYWTVQRIAM